MSRPTSWRRSRRRRAARERALRGAHGARHRRGPRDRPCHCPGAGGRGRASDELGGIDILVNNAAVVWPLGPTPAIDPADWEAAFGINVFAVLRVTQAVLPPMLERGWGRIVDISSGIVAYPGGMIGGNAYAATKAALEAHVVYLGAEVAGSGVEVNAFRPGAVDTAMQEWIREQDPDEIGAGLHDRFVSRFEAGELITPERSAAALLDHLRRGGNGQIWDVP